MHRLSVLVRFSCRPTVLSKVTTSVHKFVVAIKPKAKENWRMCQIILYYINDLSLKHI
jgi:hypothetical protein